MVLKSFSNGFKVISPIFSSLSTINTYKVSSNSSSTVDTVDK